jgi:hypothetical protein
VDELIGRLAKTACNRIEIRLLRSICLIIPIQAGNQLFLAMPGKALDSVFALHGGGEVGEFLDIDEADGTMSAGVAGTGAFVVLFKTALWIGGPAGVVGAVGTLEDVAEEGHGSRQTDYTNRLLRRVSVRPEEHGTTQPSSQ